MFGATVSLDGSRIRCAAVSLAAEDYAGKEYALEDLGDNRCGCPEANDACKVLSAGLAPLAGISGN